MEKRYTASEWAAMESEHEVVATTPKFSFINELTEARLFKYPSQVDNMEASRLAQILYCGMLALEIIRHEAQPRAYQYAMKSITYGDFNHMRSASTDLANLIAVLSNQKDFQNKIKINTSISAPALQSRAWLRTFLYGGSDERRTRMFLIELEGNLGISGSDLKAARRIVGNWRDSSKEEHRSALTALKRVFINHAYQLDIWKELQSVLPH
jgi:hypothetical protein